MTKLREVAKKVSTILGSAIDLGTLVARSSGLETADDLWHQQFACRIPPEPVWMTDSPKVSLRLYKNGCAIVRYADGRPTEIRRVPGSVVPSLFERRVEQCKAGVVDHALNILLRGK